MTRLNAEMKAEQLNKKAPKGLCYYAANTNDGWAVKEHDGRRK